MLDMASPAKLPCPFSPAKLPSLDVEEHFSGLALPAEKNQKRLVSERRYKDLIAVTKL